MDDMIKEYSDGYIELKFGPRWKYIAAARGFIQNFIAISIEDKGKADKIAMAASELLENAVKYASGEETQLFVYVFPETGGIKIAVINQATPKAAETLTEIYKKISQKPPMEAYIEQMKEAATREDGKSQLGLARIRYEAAAEIDLSVSDNSEIQITLSVN